MQKLLLIPYRILLEFKLKIVNFYFLNIRKINSGKLSYESIPSCYQRTFITGEGQVIIGKNCNFGYKLGGFYRGGCIEIQSRYKNAVIKIGCNVSINNNLFICAANEIDIGDQTLIGQYVCKMDHEPHGTEINKRNQVGVIGNVKIGKNSWIGNNVTILKNSEIGENSIVATGSVVTGKFPAKVIIGGIPAKII